jgi:hypothetical protein
LIKSIKTRTDREDGPETKQYPRIQRKLTENINHPATSKKRSIKK